MYERKRLSQDAEHMERALLKLARVWDEEAKANPMMSRRVAASDLRGVLAEAKYGSRI